MSLQSGLVWSGPVWSGGPGPVGPVPVGPVPVGPVPVGCISNHVAVVFDGHDTLAFSTVFYCFCYLSLVFCVFFQVVFACAN